MHCASGARGLNLHSAHTADCYSSSGCLCCYPIDDKWGRSVRQALSLLALKCTLQMVAGKDLTLLN